MEITIIGWYGTETIGDRAILAGILKFFFDSIGNYKINLGSLYPFFSQRTLSEDNKFWKQILGTSLEVKLFDSKNISELDRALSKSDLIIMGGGPLMHIEQLYMISYAFKKANKLGKKTALIGCGIGPLFSRSYQSCLLDIIENSCLVILRDLTSHQQLKEIERLLGRTVNTKVITSIDPSVETCMFFKKVFKPRSSKGYIAINLREFPEIYSNTQISKQINDKLIQVVRTIALGFPDYLIKLVPMHYFHYGNDDREYLNSIGRKIGTHNLSVQNKPLTLYQTMEMFLCAEVCYGMRLHSVIFQTILNGNNFILDYTEPGKGKITGFLKEIDSGGFYKNRYINLQSQNDYGKLIPTENIGFKLPTGLINKNLEKYTAAIKELF